MHVLSLEWLLAVVALVSFLAGLAWRKLALHWQVVDLPGKRRSHAEIIPSSGGIAILVAICLGALLGFPWGVLTAVVLLVAIGLAALGFWDDRQDLSIQWRLAVQAVIVLVVVAAFYWVPVFNNDLVPPLVAVLTGALFFVAGIWLINLYNFMDGSNGLAGLQCTFVLLLLAWLCSDVGAPELTKVALVVAAAVIGFLPLNWPQAKLFMGDAGSAMLGGLIGALLVFAVSTEILSVAVALLITATFAADATYTLVYRWWSGQRWYTPHRQHAYQKLIRMGMTHMQVSIIYLAVNILVILPAAYWAQQRPQLQIALLVGVYVVLALLWWSIHQTAKRSKLEAE